MSGNLIILGGSNHQMFHVAGQTYEDDRKFVPCILGGSVSVSDPAGYMSGKPTLAGIEWYVQIPNENDYSEGRITKVCNYDAATGAISPLDESVLEDEDSWRDADFLISDGSEAEWCEDVPENCLIVRKNVAASSSMIIHAVLKFVDVRTGQTVRYLCNKDFTTEVYSNDQVVMKGDCGDTLLLDPMSFSYDVPSGNTLIDVPWTRTLNVSLVGAEGDLPDNEACYQWVVGDSTVASGFREFTADEIAAMNISGMRTKQLSLDMRLIDGDTRLRCYGQRRFPGDEWSSPLSEDSPFYECTLTPTMNQNFTFVPTLIKGAYPGVDMSGAVKYEMSIYYNNRPVPEEKKCLFLIRWMAENLRNGTVSELGWGHEIEFIPKDFDLPFPEGMNVYGEIMTFDGCRIVVDSSNWLTQDDALIIVPAYN